MGVFHPDLVGIQARVLKTLGSKHVMVVHGAEGLDEISISGPTFVAELKNGALSDYMIEPSQFGLTAQSLDSLRAVDKDQSLKILMDVLNNVSGAAKDIVSLNAGAAIYVAGMATDLKAGVVRAREMIETGRAKAKLDELIRITNNMAPAA